MFQTLAVLKGEHVWHATSLAVRTSLKYTCAILSRPRRSLLHKQDGREHKKKSQDLLMAKEDLTFSANIKPNSDACAWLATEHQRDMGRRGRTQNHYTTDFQRGGPVWSTCTDDTNFTTWSAFPRFSGSLRSRNSGLWLLQWAANLRYHVRAWDSKIIWIFISIHFLFLLGNYFNFQIIFELCDSIRKWTE